MTQNFKTWILGGGSEVCKNGSETRGPEFTSCILLMCSLERALPISIAWISPAIREILKICSEWNVTRWQTIFSLCLCLLEPWWRGGLVICSGPGDPKTQSHIQNSVWNFSLHWNSTIHIIHVTLFKLCNLSNFRAARNFSLKFLYRIGSKFKSISFAIFCISKGIALASLLDLMSRLNKNYLFVNTQALVKKAWCLTIMQT